MLIVCSASVFRLELPQHSDPPCKLSCQINYCNFIHLAPKTITCVDVLCCPAVPDGKYYGVPLPYLLLTHCVAVPYTVLSITCNKTWLPVVNFGFSSRVLPQGISVAKLCSLLDSQVEAFALNASVVAHHAPPKTNCGSCQILNMIAADLPLEHVKALQSLLGFYQDIFNFGDQVLGQTAVVHHRIRPAAVV